MASRAEAATNRPAPAPSGGRKLWREAFRRRFGGETTVVSVALALVALTSVRAAEPGSENPLPQQAREALARATAFMQSISTQGGYLWRYSADLSERAGENNATATQVWVQPPGTPAVGMAFLRAYETTGHERHLEAAKAAADALATGQLESGGWDYLIDFDPARSVQWYRRSDVEKISATDAAKRRNTSTYDDDTTQSAIRLLLAVAAVAPDSTDPRDVRIRAARDYALTKLLAAQRPTGGWPQRWSGLPAGAGEFPVEPARLPEDYPRTHPPRHNYSGYYTLNDNTHRDCVITLLEAAKRLDEPSLHAAALRGGEFLLLAQLPEPQGAWAQQYNPRLEPAWARAFEPPSICSSESAGALRLLVDLYLETGDERFIASLPRAVAWFRRSEIEPGTWARMYELGTNTPIYGDRDGRIKYRLEDLSPERQTGYSWRGSYGIPNALAYYDEVKSAGREAVLAKRRAAEERAKTPRGHAAQARRLEPRVRDIVAALDAEGRWLATYRGGPWIRTDRFIEHVHTLADYLEATK